MKSQEKQRTTGAAFSFAAWRPGAAEGARSTADLVGDFLLVTESLPREEAARIAGVSVGTLARWSRTPGHSLGRATRQRIERHLARRERALRAERGRQAA